MLVKKRVPLTILYLTINYYDECNDFLCGPYARDIIDILWVNDCVLTMTYEFLTMRSPKYYKLDVM